MNAMSKYFWACSWLIFQMLKRIFTQYFTCFLKTEARLFEVKINKHGQNLKVFTRGADESLQFCVAGWRKTLIAERHTTHISATIEISRDREGRRRPGVIELRAESGSKKNRRTLFFLSFSHSQHGALVHAHRGESKESKGAKNSRCSRWGGVFFVCGLGWFCHEIFSGIRINQNITRGNNFSKKTSTAKINCGVHLWVNWTLCCKRQYVITKNKNWN